MVLKRLLLQKKAAVVERWCQLILETYPADTARFLGQDADRFANPVGYTMHHEIDVLYDGIVQEVELDKLSGSVDNMVRVRSVGRVPTFSILKVSSPVPSFFILRV